MSFKPGHLQAYVNTMALENCIKDIKHWMIQNDLKLNTDKTVFLLFGTPQQLANTLLMLRVILWKENDVPEILVSSQIVA